MEIMLATTYAAFKAAGVNDEQAEAAAEELADYENRLSSIEHRLAVIDVRLIAVETRLTSLESRFIQFSTDVGSRFTMLTGAVGINAAATIAILGVLLRGHGP